MKLFTEHVAFIASVGGLLFVALRLLMISEGSWETAAAVIQSQGSGSVALAALLTAIPILPIFAANIWFSWFIYEGRTIGFLDGIVLVSLIALIAMITPWFMGAVAVAVMAVGLLVIRGIGRQSKRKSKPKSEREPTEKPDAADEDPGETPAQVAQTTAPADKDQRPSMAPLTFEQLSQKSSELDTLSAVLAELKAIVADMQGNSPRKWRDLPERLSTLSSSLSSVHSPDLQDSRESINESVQDLSDRSEELSAASNRMLKTNQATLTLTGVAVALVTIAASPVWLPLEKIEIKGEVYVGYVLNDADKDVVILQDQPRGVTRIEGEADRTFCTEPDDETGSALLRWVTDSSPALMLLTSSRFRYPDCPAEP